MGVTVEEVMDIVSRDPKIYKSKEDIRDVTKILKSVDSNREELVKLFKNIDENDINECWEETSVNSDCTDEYNREVGKHNLNAIKKNKKIIQRAIPGINLDMTIYDENENCYKFPSNECKCMVSGKIHNKPCGEVLINKVSRLVLYVCHDGCGFIPFDGTVCKMPKGSLMDMKLNVNLGTINNTINNYYNKERDTIDDKKDRAEFEMRSEKITIFDKDINVLISDTFRMVDDTYLELIKKSMEINNIKYDKFNDKWYRMKGNYFKLIKDIDDEFYKKIFVKYYKTLSDYFIKKKEDMYKIRFLDNIFRELSNINMKNKLIKGVKQYGKIHIKNKINENLEILTFGDKLYDLSTGKIRNIKKRDYVSLICSEKINNELTNDDKKKFRNFFRLYSNNGNEFMDIIKMMGNLIFTKDYGNVIICTGEKEIDYKFTNLFTKCFSGYIRYENWESEYGERVVVHDDKVKYAEKDGTNHLLIAVNNITNDKILMKRAKIIFKFTMNDRKDSGKILKFVDNNYEKFTYYVLEKYRKCTDKNIMVDKRNKYLLDINKCEREKLMKFIGDCIEKTDKQNDFITVQLLKDIFQNWCKLNKINDAKIDRTFVKNMRLCTFQNEAKTIKISGKTYRGWRGFWLSKYAYENILNKSKNKLNLGIPMCYNVNDSDDDDDDSDDTDDTDNASSADDSVDESVDDIVDDDSD